MIVARARSAILVCFVAACSVSLELPAGAEIACEEDDTCPDDWTCDLVRNLCVRTGEIAPTLTVAFPPGNGLRPMSSQEVVLTVADSNADPVDVTATYSVDNEDTTNR